MQEQYHCLELTNILVTMRLVRSGSSVRLVPLTPSGRKPSLSIQFPIYIRQIGAVSELVTRSSAKICMTEIPQKWLKHQISNKSIMRVKGTRNIHASSKSMIVLKKKWNYFSWRLLESHFVDTKGVIVSVSIIVDKDVTSKALYRYLSRWFFIRLKSSKLMSFQFLFEVIPTYF